jgi:CDP-6-deoxy-D-xylo-4-hexulose-3-dehydrase
MQAKLNDLRNKILNLVEDYSNEAFLKKPFNACDTFIPATGKVIGANEIKNIVDAALDGWLTTGRFNDLFEARLAKFIGIDFLFTVNSGSSANLIAFSTLTSSKLGNRAIKKGDEIISVAAGFPTTINPILQYGAIPVFVDIDIPTYNINIFELEAAITSKTKAIMIAHTLGNPFDLERVSEIAKKYNLWLIEDCCDALGATYNGKHVGTFGDIATLSFYPAHHITMGEGGAVFTGNQELKAIAESFRDWGRDCYCKTGCDNTCGKRFNWKMGDLPLGYDHKYIYTHAGYNFKITDMQAACGLAQLDRLDNFVQARKDNFAFLKNRLASTQDYFILPEATPNSDPSWFGFPIMIKDNAPISRRDLLMFLDQHKIGTRLLFCGNVTKQPYIKDFEFKVHGELKNTDKVMNNLFHIGVYPGISEDMLEFVVKKIEEFLGLSF